MKRFIIQFSGPSCSGKSTLRDALTARNQGAYTVSYDRLKWQLAGYHRDREGDQETVTEIMKGVFRVVCNLGLGVLLDSGFRDAEAFQFYKRVAEEHGYACIFVSLSAPESLLIERFRERVERARVEGTQISVTSEEVYIKNLSVSWYIPEGAISFDTSKMNAGDIADQVMATLAGT